MYYIYKFTNKINGKSYVGQTNDIEKRKRGHKSSALNRNSNNYNVPFHNAIRKYGWHNFDFEIVEEISDSFGRDYVNERECFFIRYFKSLTTEGGYNVAEGGVGVKRKLTFEECCNQSKILNFSDVVNIQQMLKDGYQYFEIKKKYPMLTDSFLTNINTGLNFRNDELEYPLSKYHTKFAKETVELIKNDIKNGIEYHAISTKYDISVSFISQISNGKRLYDPNETYPLCKKGCADGKWSKECKRDIILTNAKYEDLAKKYGKSVHAIKSVAEGAHHIDKRLKYPLRKYRNYNKTLVV